jgi:hypothetical protein
MPATPSGAKMWPAWTSQAPGSRTSATAPGAALRTTRAASATPTSGKTRRPGTWSANHRQDVS